MNWIRRCWTIAALVLVAGAMCGCQAVGVAGKVFGGAADPAEYQMPKANTLVLVEPNRQILLDQEDLSRVGRLVERELTAHEVAPLVDSTPLVAAPEKYQQMTAAQKGAALGAKQVVQIKLERYDVQDVIGGQASVNIRARVRVYDTASGKDVWPGTFEGHPVDFAGPMNGGEGQKLAGKIGELFYSRN